MPNAILAAETLPIRYTDTDAFSLATRVFSRRVIRDRFGVLNYLSPYKFAEICESIPTPVDGMDFSEIMDAVACDFLRKHNRIAVSWSGGLDSTAVVAAFLRNLCPSDYGRLSVYCTESSIIEAPRFYKLLNGLQIRILLDNKLFKAIGTAECDIVTTGCGADSFFASTSLQKAPSLYHASAYDGIQFMWTINNPLSLLSKKNASAITELFEEYGKHLGLKVKYFCDVAWLFEFGCRITNGSEKLHLFLGGYPNSNKCEAFFKHPLFTRWAIGNYEKAQSVNPYLTPTLYKAELRQYIYSFDKDEKYYSSKGKVDSLHYVDCQIDFVNVLTSDGVSHYKMPTDADWYKFATEIAEQFRK